MNFQYFLSVIRKIFFKIHCLEEFNLFLILAHKFFNLFNLIASLAQIFNFIFSKKLL